MKRTCYLILPALLPIVTVEANELPLSFEWVYDATYIPVKDNATVASRSLISLSYEQNFSIAGGTLTPQITYSAFRGRNGSDITQDVQGFSNIDAELFSRFQEVNLQWQYQDTLVRIGQLDANANFVSLENAGTFINASFGLTPTAYPLPTYPDMELGFYLEQGLTDTLSASVGYYRIDSLNEDNSQKSFWIMSSCVYCTSELEVTVGYWQVGSHVNGYFGHVETDITASIHGFALLSSNNQNRLEQINRHLKAGAVFDSPFGVENNELGVAFSAVKGPDNEFSTEIYYAMPINNYLTIQPDIQWVNNNTSPNVDNMLTTVRFILAF